MLAEHRRRSERHARRTPPGGSERMCSTAHRVRIERCRAVRGRGRARVFHRAPGRHRDRAGTGDGERAGWSCRYRRSRRWHARRPTPRAPIAAWMDAQRGEVFSELYAADGRTVAVPPSRRSPDDDPRRVGRRMRQRRRSFIGDGAVAIPADDRWRGLARPLASSSRRRSPGSIGQIAADAPGAGGAARTRSSRSNPQAGRRTGARPASARRLSAMERPGWSIRATVGRAKHGARPGRRRSKRHRSPTRGRARCSRGSCEHSDVTRVYVRQAGRPADRRVLRMLAGHRRGAHQHACGRGLMRGRGLRRRCWSTCWPT